MPKLKKDTSPIVPSLAPSPVYIGIDPSGIAPTSSGAIVVWEKSEVKICPMSSGRKELAEFLKPYANRTDVVCLLEKVASMPGQGVSSTFTFGTGYGFIQGLLFAMAIPYSDIMPKQWQVKYLPGKKMEKSVRKNALKDKAGQYFPNVKVTLKNADALLICHYAKHHFK